MQAKEVNLCLILIVNECLTVQLQQGDTENQMAFPPAELAKEAGNEVLTQ